MLISLCVFSNFIHMHTLVSIKIILLEFSCSCMRFTVPYRLWEVCWSGISKPCFALKAIPLDYAAYGLSGFKKHTRLILPWDLPLLKSILSQSHELKLVAAGEGILHGCVGLWRRRLGGKHHGCYRNQHCSSPEHTKDRLQTEEWKSSGRMDCTEVDRGHCHESCLRESPRIVVREPRRQNSQRNCAKQYYYQMRTKQGRLFYFWKLSSSQPLLLVLICDSWSFSSKLNLGENNVRKILKCMIGCVFDSWVLAFGTSHLS